MRSIFSVVVVSTFGKGLLVDERCQAILFAVYLFLDTAIFRRPPSVSIVEAKYRIFDLFTFITILAIESSMGLIFNTIVNCSCLVGALSNYCHIRREKRMKLINKFRLALSNKNAIEICMISIR